MATPYRDKGKGRGELSRQVTVREEAKMVACCPEGKGKPIGEREIEIGERERGVVQGVVQQCCQMRQY